MRREVPCAPATTHGLLLLDQEPQTSGHFRLDLPPDFAHPANRTRQPGLRGSERVLLISDAAHKATRLHARSPPICRPFPCAQGTTGAGKTRITSWGLGSSQKCIN